MASSSRSRSWTLTAGDGNCPHSFFRLEVGFAIAANEPLAGFRKRSRFLQKESRIETDR
jgi:hypothetical protein